MVITAANLRRHVARLCKRKVRHETREEALRAIRAVAAAGGVKSANVEPYPCEVCGGWHWGHSNWSDSAR